MSTPPHERGGRSLAVEARVLVAHGPTTPRKGGSTDRRARRGVLDCAAGELDPMTPPSSWPARSPAGRTPATVGADLAYSAGNVPRIRRAGALETGAVRGGEHPHVRERAFSDMSTAPHQRGRSSLAVEARVLVAASPLRPKGVTRGFGTSVIATAQVSDTEARPRPEAASA